MSIVSEISRLNANIAAAYSACSDKGAALPQTCNSANLADTIDSISSGTGSSPERKDVNFYDYDGALLYSYTAQEAQSLSALPALPQHSGLVAQEWNWTLLEIQSHLGTGQQITVGCTYDTDDGSTEFYLFVKKGTRIPELPINVSMAAQSSAVVYWGDGTSSLIENPSSSSANITVTKTDYAEVSEDTELCVTISSGSFRLENTSFGSTVRRFLTRVHIGSNCIYIENSLFSYCYQLETVSVANTIHSFGSNVFEYSRNIRFITIPRGTTFIGMDCFSGCYSLQAVAVPATVTQFAQSAFIECYSLSSATIPSGLSQFGQNAFSKCYSLRSAYYPPGITTGHGGSNSYSDCTMLLSVTIPVGVRSIYSSAFFRCYSLTHIKIPASVTQIESYAFYGAKLYELDMTAFTDPTAVPTLQNTNALGDAPEYMKITVADQTMLSAFSSATNWSTYANNFQIKGA